jgi:DNA-binding MurR/RpiR family transcriptional regulator
MADLFTTQLAKHEGSLPPACRRVARFIDGNRAAVLASSAAELGQRTGTSDATVIRTVQALGFPGLGPLKQALLSSVERLPALVEDMGRTLGEVGDDTASAIDLVFSAHADALDKLRQEAVRDRIVEAVAVLHPAARIAVFGIGPSAALATYVAMLLARTGRRTLVLNVTGAMLADQMLDLRQGDALLVLAYGRAYAEVAAVFAEARSLALPIVLVTDSLARKLSYHANVILPAMRGRPGRVALHGATLVCLEAVVLGLAAVTSETMPTLRRLGRLRAAAAGDATARLETPNAGEGNAS